MFQKLILFSLSLSLLSASGACVADTALPRYRVVEMDKRLILASPHCINNFGVVIGEVIAPPKHAYQGQCYQSYRWKNEHLTNLKVIESTFPSSTPAAINDRGQIVGVLDYGTIEMNFHSYGHAFLWERDKWQDVGSLIPGEVSSADAINNNGEVAINTQDSDTQDPELFSLDYPDPGIQESAYLYRKGKTQFLAHGETIALNNRSQVLLQDWNHHHYLWDSGKITSLEALDKAGLAVYDMNDLGKIVGRDAQGLFLYQNGQFILLDTAPDSDAHSLNNHGQVAGSFELPNVKRGTFPPPHACLRQNGKRYDLNRLISPSSGWVLVDAASINDREQIVGSGFYHGKRSTFLMSPTTRSVKGREQKSAKHENRFAGRERAWSVSEQVEGGTFTLRKPARHLNMNNRKKRET